MTSKLTSLSHGAGCGCKIGAAALEPLLAGLPDTTGDPAVLVGPATADESRRQWLQRLAMTRASS